MKLFLVRRMDQGQIFYKFFGPNETIKLINDKIKQCFQLLNLYIFLDPEAAHDLLLNH